MFLSNSSYNSDCFYFIFVIVFVGPNPSHIIDGFYRTEFKSITWAEIIRGLVTNINKKIVPSD
jgi:hypothetical protein